MSSTESKITYTISWTDEIIKFIVFNIIVTKILNVIFRKIKPKLTLGGKSHFRNTIVVIFGVDYLMLLFKGLAYFPPKEKATEYTYLLLRFLRLHKSYHNIAGNNVCCVCLNIGLFQSLFQRYVPDPQLYPDLENRLKQSSKLLTSFF